MKIELKHLAPYLPYELNMVGCQSKMSAEILQRFIDNDFEITPILRPLSDLTKEIEHNGEKFVPYKRLLEAHIKDGKHYRDIMYCIQPAKFYIIFMPYQSMQKLFEWHFNVFDLPEELYIKKA